MCAARLAKRGEEPAYDAIESEGSPVIIAGFGRVGQIIGRLLYASGLRATVLDHDPDQIEILRRFGFRIFYGDATRADLLEAAGAGQATLLINAIDDMDDSLELADIVREKWPNLKMIARARNVTHYFELRERGVEIIERETFEAALSLGRRALMQLGKPAFEAQELSNRFKRHNIRTLEAMNANYNDEATRVSLAKAARVELEQQFERDREALRTSVGESKGWQLESET